MQTISGSRISLLVLAAMILGGSIVSARADDLSKLLSDNQSLSSDVLAKQRGGTAPQVTANANAVVSDNYVAPFSVTGTNTANNAINNSFGLFNVLQNSGNNVAIQSQIIVNANIQ